MLGAVSYPETGFFWHLHHDILVEWCTGYTKRVQYIKAEKPVGEITLRLHLMRPVVGILPHKVQQAGAELNKAGAELSNARAESIVEITARHEQECPACPWDGATIFPQAR